MLTHNVKVIFHIYKFLYSLIYHVILPIRHGVPFVVLLYDEEEIAVPPPGGGQEFLFARGVVIFYGDMAVATSVSC